MTWSSIKKVIAKIAAPRVGGDMAGEIGRRAFIAALGGVAAWPLTAGARSGDQIRRLAVLMPFAAKDPEAKLRESALEEGLRQLGWVNERNLRIEYRWAESHDALQAYASELIRMAPDVILVNSTPAAAALHKQPHTVPIVFTQVTDPIGAGLITNFAHPGGHITGFTTFEFSIGTKWLETLKQMAPRVTRVALAFNPQTAPFAHLFWQPVQAAAASFGIEPVSVGMQTFEELEHKLDEFAREPDGGLIVLPDVSTVNYRVALIGLAARLRLPAVYPFRIFATSGGLLSYGTDVADIFRRAAVYVDRILNGANPGELPVQAPSKYELVINLNTAKALGIELPDRFLAIADEVIE
jgi:putative ABC transport system substrate-binding protein